MFDAWERLPLKIKRAFIDYATADLEELEAKAGDLAARRAAEAAANAANDDFIHREADPT